MGIPTTDLPALREAVAIIQRGVPRDQAGVYDDRTPLELAALRLALALPALLDELETLRRWKIALAPPGQMADQIVALKADLAAARAQLHTLENKCVVSESAYTQQLEADLAAERIENTHLREAFVTMEKAYNTAEADLAAARTSEKRAWDEAVQARIDGAENLMLLTHELQADLAAAKAVLDSAIVIEGPGDITLQVLDRAAWQAWQARGKP